ncbi:MAG: signal peptidase I [Oscillospiraceae bacterium]|nr:signal peptidase I [Oscillospiraceae bacterium]
MKVIVKVITLTIFSVCLLFLMTCALRVFVCDRFIIKGDSMAPTYESGEAVWVNKLLMGARIYTDFDFSSSELKAFRMPGFKKPETGDVVIFNYPHGRDNYKIEFRINYVYAKRILGCPGDVIGIKDGICYKEGFDGTFGVKEIQETLSKTPESQLGYSKSAFPLTDEVGWTVYDTGPLRVPAKGMSVPMTRLNYILYRHVIEYETGEMPLWENGQCFSAGKPITYYAFLQDYYYLIGDNVLNSKDSRYFGFVPELYIIGIIK